MFYALRTLSYSFSRWQDNLFHRIKYFIFLTDRFLFYSSSWWLQFSFPIHNCCTLHSIQFILPFLIIHKNVSETKFRNDGFSIVEKINPLALQESCSKRVSDNFSEVCLVGLFSWNRSTFYHQSISLEINIHAFLFL